VRSRRFVADDTTRKDNEALKGDDALSKVALMLRARGDAVATFMNQDSKSRAGRSAARRSNQRPARAAHRPRRRQRYAPHRRSRLGRPCCAFRRAATSGSCTILKSTNGTAVRARRTSVHVVAVDPVPARAIGDFIELGHGDKGVRLVVSLSKKKTTTAPRRCSRCGASTTSRGQQHVS